MFFETLNDIAVVPRGVAITMVAFGIALIRWRFRRPPISARHHRGRVLRDAEQVHANLPAHADSFRFGSCRLPHRLAYGHLAVVGATGSGKTLLQRLMMQSILPRIGLGAGQRALVYDAKQDILSLLAGMDLKAPVHVLNPLDSRSVAWDMAADITSPAAALQAATLLIPKAAQDANPFFSNAARHLLYGVVIALILKAPRRWTLRHVILILQNESLIRQVLRSHDVTRYLLQYFEHEATMQNILSTVLTRLSPFEIIAAAWDRSKVRLSLRQWVQRESILVLGNDEDNRAALDTINQLVFKRISELVLAQPEIPQGSTNATWLLLDEVRQAGRLDGLSALMTKGRSKGASVLLGFQDISGLREVYGREGADELVGQCNTKAILRLNSPETAHWASQVIGASEFIETRKSQSKSRSFHDHHLRQGGSSGVSVSATIAKRDLVLDSEFMDFPETTPEEGLTGIIVSPVTGAFRDHLSGEWLTQHLCPPRPNVRNFVPRPESHQYLRPWSPEDTNELCLNSASSVRPTVTRG